MKIKIRKSDLRKVVDQYFKGSVENALMALVGCLAVLAAVLIIFVGRSASSGGGHGHGGEHEEGEEGARSIELSDDAIASSGIKLETVKKLTIQRIVKLRGRISVNRDRYAKIGSRYSGTVQIVTKGLGDQVAKGETLARVESAAARAAFDVRSGISGIIVDRQAVRGVFVSDKEPMFTVVDLSNVWAELNASDTDFLSLKAGQKVKITDAETGKTAESTVSYVSPNVYEDTQSLVVRAVIDNKEKIWRPGSFIEAEVHVEDKEVAAAIRLDAVQTLDNKATIFVKNGDAFEARDVVLGTSDTQFAELVSGASEGETYIGSNSFIAKAELLKSSAEHEH
jgi:cobalt-zinc-cadmium efflux system membrane fusion protein